MAGNRIKGITVEIGGRYYEIVDCLEGGDTEGCGAAWCCVDPGGVPCYGEVACEAGCLCEEGQDQCAVF